MSLIKIKANGIQLDFVKESLTVKKDNNSFILDFKISHSSVPFLIIENKAAKQALGSRDITSVNKPIIIEVNVFESGKNYIGYLEQLSVIPGFRKCNLKYSSAVITLFSKKLNELMPKIYINPLINPFPDYVQTYLFAGLQYEGYWFGPINIPGFIPYNQTRMQLGFPDLKYQFPTIFDPKRYGDNLANSEEWNYYQGKVNNYGNDGYLIRNIVTNNTATVSVQNKNVISPQLYLLSPLFYAFESVGFKIKGDFYTSDFIRKLLIYSNNDNLTTGIARAYENFITMGMGIGGIPPEVSAFAGFKIADLQLAGKSIFSFSAAGSYDFKWDYVIPFSDQTIDSNFSALYLHKTSTGEVFELFHIGRPGYNQEQHPTGSIVLDILSSDVGVNFNLVYLHWNGSLPSSYRVTYFDANNIKKIYLFNPTIDLNRYVPDWTFPTYLNELKKLFNLEINLDDFNKTVNINFVKNNLLDSKIYKCNRSLKADTIDYQDFNKIEFGFDNDEENLIYFNNSGFTTSDKLPLENVLSVKSKFKFLKYNGVGHVVDKDIKENNNIGLMILNPARAPYTSDNFQGITLSISSIFINFNKSVYKSRLNSGKVTVNGYFTETEMSKLNKVSKIYIDNQLYFVASTELSEGDDSLFSVKMNLESVIF